MKAAHYSVQNNVYVIISHYFGITWRNEAVEQEES